MAQLQTEKVMPEKTRADLRADLVRVNAAIPLDTFRDVHQILAEIQAAQRRIINDKLNSGRRDEAREVVSRGTAYLAGVSRMYGADLTRIGELERIYRRIEELAERYDLSVDDLTALL